MLFLAAAGVEAEPSLIRRHQGLIVKFPNCCFAPTQILSFLSNLPSFHKSLQKNQHLADWDFSKNFLFTSSEVFLSAIKMPLVTRSF